MEHSVEYRLDRAEDDIRELKNTTSELHKDLKNLINALNSIKFWLYGVGSFYVINEAGLTPLIKKFLGI